MTNAVYRDSGCTLKYKDLSSSSHSNRKAVEVRWSKPQESYSLPVEDVTIKSNAYTTFASMDTIATATSQQAEGYISTLVLFLIFAQNTKEGKAYMRLPGVWRDLYTEFSNVKKAQEEEADKDMLRGLKGMIEANTSSEDDVVLSGNFKKRKEAAAAAAATATATATNKGESPKRPPRGSSPEVFKKIWADKSSTASYQHMVLGRKNLPVWGFREDIIKALDTHRAIIICSETGSGKSTQIPSFIVENELRNGKECKVYVTEPRRISAISLARRVSEELGESKNDVGTTRSLVGYAVRLESKVSQTTRLVYAYVFILPFSLVR